MYLIAIGGATYLVSRAIGSTKVIAFEVENMQVTVAVDAKGRSVHDIGPAEWRKRIGMIPVRLV